MTDSIPPSVYITLVSCDNVHICIPKSIAVQSKLVSTVLETDTDATEVNIHSVYGTTLEQIVHYMTYNTLPDLFYTNPWNRDMTYNLLSASDYMIIPPLLEAVCTYIVDVMKDKSPEEIRSIMDIHDDLSVEQRSKLIQDTSWVLPYI